MRILIADDTRLMRDMLGTLLTGFGYQVDVARDGVEALALWRAHRHAIVLTDWEMPQMDGIELCWHIRAQADWASCYLVVLTASEAQGGYAQALEAGADDFLHKPVDPTTLRARVRSGERILQATRALERLATTDPLTGILNRGGFMARTVPALDHARRLGVPVGLLLLDVDHFKHINDTHGHDTGDRALMAVAAAAQGVLRSHDLLGRVGGEEFCILLPGAGAEDTRAVAERVRRAVAAVSVPLEGGGTLTMTASLGATLVDSAERDIHAASMRADRALYTAKGAGRNRVEVSP